MFRSKRSCLGFMLGMLFSTWALAYILVYLLTGRLAVPGQEGTRFVTAREAADELDALVGDKEEAEDEA